MYLIFIWLAYHLLILKRLCIFYRFGNVESGSFTSGSFAFSIRHGDMFNRRVLAPISQTFASDAQT